MAVDAPIEWTASGPTGSLTWCLHVSACVGACVGASVGLLFFRASVSVGGLVG